jgi:hypothetical protein
LPLFASCVDAGRSLFPLIDAIGDDLESKAAAQTHEGVHDPGAFLRT